MKGRFDKIQYNGKGFHFFTQGRTLSSSALSMTKQRYALSFLQYLSHLKLLAGKTWIAWKNKLMKMLMTSRCLWNIAFYQPRSGMVMQNCRSKKKQVTFAVLVIVTSVLAVFGISLESLSLFFNFLKNLKKSNFQDKNKKIKFPIKIVIHFLLAQLLI